MIPRMAEHLTKRVQIQAVIWLARQPKTSIAASSSSTPRNAPRHNVPVTAVAAGRSGWCCVILAKAFQRPVSIPVVGSPGRITFLFFHRVHLERADARHCSTDAMSSRTLIPRSVSTVNSTASNVRFSCPSQKRGSRRRNWKRTPRRRRQWQIKRSRWIEARPRHRQSRREAGMSKSMVRTSTFLVQGHV